jgi:hypothetical protein
MLSSSRATAPHGAVGIAALLACGLIAAGCGGDDGTTTTSNESPTQRIDSAVESCTFVAEHLYEGLIGGALGPVCREVGRAAKRDLRSAGGDVSRGLSEAAASCRKSIHLRGGHARVRRGVAIVYGFAGEQERDVRHELSSLCDAIEGAAQNGG